MGILKVYLLNFTILQLFAVDVQRSLDSGINNLEKAEKF